jgi:hypothetical protein
MENFNLLRQHFRIICEHMAWRLSGEILVLVAGVAHAPKLFDRKYELIRKAGLELINGEISPSVSEAIA